MYARELFDGETLTDFLDSTSKFIYLEPEREYINVKDSGMTEKVAGGVNLSRMYIDYVICIV